MKSNRRDLVIGLVIIGGILGLIFWSRRNEVKVSVTSPTATPQIVEENLERSFNVTIPDNLEKTSLNDLTGGDSAALATHNKFENSTYEFTVLADLPDPASGFFYQVWLTRGKTGDANFATISLGKMRLAKGGWLLEYNSKTDYRDYKNVTISLERIFDNTIEKPVLQGSFQ